MLSLSPRAMGLSWPCNWMARPAPVLLQSQTLSAPTFLVVETNAYLPDDVLLHIEHKCQDLQSIIPENRHCDPGSQLDCFPIRQAKPKEVIPRRRCTQRW